jgi:SPX domain protein involved in polyphosphate accumulation
MYDWRYEIKFTVADVSFDDILQSVLYHPAGFRMAFPDRVVNNIYFDTPDFTCCRENLAGISERKKFRIRWYDNAKEGDKAKLEVKIKENALGRKLGYPIEFTQDLAKLSAVVNEKLIFSDSLRPTLNNGYRRSYYESSCGGFRLTIDREMTFKPLYSTMFENSAPSITDPRIIIEVKFPEKNMDRLREITAFIPFRQTKHSKYVSGVMACNH